MEAYLADRSDLIAKDRARRNDTALPMSNKCILQGDGETEKRADINIRALRKWEIENIWTPPRIFNGDSEERDLRDLFPGMGFLTAKKRIESSKLLSFLKKMPKGGLLHAHFDATVDIRTLMSLALSRPNIHIRIKKPFPQGLTSIGSCDSTDLPLAEFTTLHPSEVDKAARVSIVGRDYILGTWLPMAIARECFPSELEGPNGFDEWLYRSMTIDPVEAYETHSTVTRIWDKFATTFDVCDGLIRNEPVFREYTKRSLLTAIKDGISYVEYRMLFFAKTMFTPEGDDVLEHRDWLKIFLEAMESVKLQLRDEDRGCDFVGAKVIYTTLRHISMDEMKWYMEDCLSLKAEFPDLIAGFDIVGAEDKGHPLLHYIDSFMWFKERQKELGLDVPLILHAGETLGDGDITDDNVYDAILLGTKRIGHGFSMAKHPYLMELCKERDIALEVCPISNEVLRLTSTMPMHPLAIFLAHGVPVTVNCDDPAMWGSVGVSYDYYQILISSETAGLMTLADIARRSITASCLADAEKQVALEMWQRKWNGFVEELAGL